MNDRFYDSYRYDRDLGMSHAQIVADGCYPADEVEEYGRRFDAFASAYANAMLKQEQMRRLEGNPDAPQIGPCGRRLHRYAR
jgi:hypothetical protein